MLVNLFDSAKQPFLSPGKIKKKKKRPMDTPILQTRRLQFREVKTVHRGAGLQGNANVKKTDSIGSAQKETVELSQLGETEKFSEACSSLLNRLILSRQSPGVLA